MKNFKSEFDLFLKTSHVELPARPTHNLLRKIKGELRDEVKPFWNILVKFFFLQFSAGVLTLSVCPQFGIGPIGGGHGISHYFMQFGMWACAIFCATFFFMLSFVFASYFLSRCEIKRMSHNQNWALPLVTTLSFLILIGAGHGFSTDEMFFTFEFQLTWLLTGLILTQLTWSLRTKRSLAAI